MLPGADRPANFGSKAVESCRLPQKSLIRQSRKVNHEIRKMADLPVKFPLNYVVDRNDKSEHTTHLDNVVRIIITCLVLIKKMHGLRESLVTSVEFSFHYFHVVRFDFALFIFSG